MPHTRGFNAAGEDLLVNAIIWTATRDTDKDGTPDCLDTDSDGDGCNDADEAYGDPNTDSDDNGMYGTGNPPINGDGTVTAATYTTPVDGELNGIADYLEVGISPSITSQPANMNLCPGCSGSFTVVTTNADTFQWQIFNGSIWVNLSDTGIYNGSSTNNMTITNATTSENGNQYRVIGSNSAYICNPVISNTAILTVSVPTVITNRRITYRIKKN